MVSTRPLISKSSSPLNNPSVTVPRTPITIGINATFMCHKVFNSLARSRYLPFFSISFNFILWSAETTIIIIISLLETFFTVILIGSKCPRVSRTLLSIPADLNNAVFCMVSILTLIFNSFSLYSKPFGTVSSAPTKIGITETFLFYSFFQLLCKIQIFFYLFVFFYFHEIWWSFCFSKFKWIFCISFFQTDSGLCIYHLLVWSNDNLLPN